MFSHWRCLTEPPPVPLTRFPPPFLLCAIPHHSDQLLPPSGIIPAPFKTATVKPLLKKPALESADIQNYRPVSLLSFLSKTLERAVYNQLSSYLSENDLLDPHQSGFRTGHLTEMALLTVSELLGATRALSSFSSFYPLWIRVNHQILLSTLAELGITDSALTWFTSYLTNRTFQVTWNGSLSKPCFMETGVPQGSVLGLLLFPLYTRSLGSAITSHWFSYHCWRHPTHFPHHLPTPTLQQTFQLGQCHHLKLNVGKTELPVSHCRGCHSIALAIGEEPGHNPRQRTILRPKHHCCGSILQIFPLQH